MSFTCCCRKWLSRKSPRWSLHGQTPGHIGAKRPVSGSSWEWQLPHHPGFYPAHLETSSACSERKRSCWAGFAFLRDSAPSSFSWPIWGKMWPMPEPYHRSRNRWEVGVGGLQMHVDQAVDSLTLGRITLMYLGSSWLMGKKELSSKHGVGWTQWSRIAEWLILKIETGKKVGGWPETGARGVPGSLLSDHCWSERQICGTVGRTARFFSCMGYYKILSIVPCARPVLVDYLYYVVCIC